MPNLECLKNKFLILKHDDAVKYLNDKEKADYNYMANKIECGRERREKPS